MVRIDNTTYAHLSKGELSTLRKACKAMNGTDWRPYAVRPKVAREVIALWDANDEAGFLTIMLRKAQEIKQICSARG